MRSVCPGQRAKPRAARAPTLIATMVMLRTSDELDPKLREPSSPVRRVLKEAGRAPLGAERACRHGSASHPAARRKGRAATRMGDTTVRPSAGRPMAA
jgi:hypothetical protein